MISFQVLCIKIRKVGDNGGKLFYTPFFSNNYKTQKGKKHTKIWENTNLLAIVISPVSLLKMHLILRWENSAITPKGFW